MWVAAICECRICGWRGGYVFPEGMDDEDSLLCPNCDNKTCEICDKPTEEE